MTEPHALRRLLAALGLAAEPPPGTSLPTRSYTRGKSGEPFPSTPLTASIR